MPKLEEGDELNIERQMDTITTEYRQLDLDNLSDEDSMTPGTSELAVIEPAKEKSQGRKRKQSPTGDEKKDRKTAVESRGVKCVVCGESGETFHHSS